jgi:hypothetical protein
MGIGKKRKPPEAPKPELPDDRWELDIDGRYTLKHKDGLINVYRDGVWMNTVTTGMKIIHSLATHLMEARAAIPARETKLKEELTGALRRIAQLEEDTKELPKVRRRLYEQTQELADLRTWKSKVEAELAKQGLSLKVTRKDDIRPQLQEDMDSRSDRLDGKEGNLMP